MNVWCVRAEFGTYAQRFVDGGFTGIGWLHDDDLSPITLRDELYPLYRKAYPKDTSSVVVGQQVGQIARFRLEMKAGDCILTPASNTDEVFYGVLKPNGYHYAKGDDGCPYRHRLWVDWSKEPLKRSIFSVPLQNTMRSSLTVFSVSQRDEILALVGRGELVKKEAPTQYDPYKVVLEQILELRDDEFEVLTAHLLTALGFEGTKVTGKTGDGGVDAMGELNVANLAKVKIFLQAKRYKLGTRIRASVVRELRQAIPRDGQGAFITTADYQAAAHEIALDPDFPRIGLINGHQLVDLLIEHWEDIPEEFRRQLGLRPGLVRV